MQAGSVARHSSAGRTVNYSIAGLGRWAVTRHNNTHLQNELNNVKFVREGNEATHTGLLLHVQQAIPYGFRTILKAYSSTGCDAAGE